MSMTRQRFATAVAVGGLFLTGLAATTTSASADSARTTVEVQTATSEAAKRVPQRFKNCTNLRKKWPHGVGRRNARDKTSGDPVTSFKRSNKIYKKAMRHNRGLDRDKDKIACEQH